MINGKNKSLTKLLSFYLIYLLTLLLPCSNEAAIKVGVGKASITPEIGTYSAGYSNRKQGMQGIHDPLLAIALFIDTGNKQIVFCSVDHLGFTYEMTQTIIQHLQKIPELKNCEIYIGSSHTHSGGGSYLNIPIIGELLAGAYCPRTTQFYINQTVEAILQASRYAQPAKIGVGYGHVDELSDYRGTWPKHVNPLSDVAVIKVTQINDTPLAVLFNYPVHPTILKHQNLLFSADFVGYTREILREQLGNNIQALYFNGAQGDIIPTILDDNDHFHACQLFGEKLAATVCHIWHMTPTHFDLDITSKKEKYSFTPQATPEGLTLPIKEYKSEINLITLNKSYAFITIPGELSTLYDRHFKAVGKQLGYAQVSIFGLTNDAHGYMILPESWKHQTFESKNSFGGENYGEQIKNKVEKLLQESSPLNYKSFQQD